MNKLNKHALIAAGEAAGAVVLLALLTFLLDQVNAKAVPIPSVYFAPAVAILTWVISSIRAWSTGHPWPFVPSGRKNISPPQPPK